MDQANELRHVAVILDGNGRWAAQHGVERKEGHLAGANRVVDFMNYIGKYDSIRYVTLYAFSTENWKRSKDEVDALMNILARFLDENLEVLLKEKVRLLTTGDISALPEACRVRLDKVKRETAKDFTRTFILALNYGSRMEITDAVKSIAAEVKDGKLSLDDITEKTVADHLYLPEVPDPDLLIRTSGEERVSNFLLWQISYSEFYFTKTLWPDFDINEFDKAVQAFYGRKRRFGGR
jgi:undecaprenyl diphosphate synthase